MTTPPRNADELVSAYLDGEAAPEEVIEVESRPELMARVEELRSLSERLAYAPPAPAALREAQIGAALDLFDELAAADRPSTAATTATEPATDVVSLASERLRRRPRRLNLIAAAAAAVAVLFIGVTALSLSRSSDSTDLADTATSEVSDGSADAARAAFDLPEAEGAADEPEIAAAAPAEEPAAAQGLALSEAEPADEPADETAEERSLAASEPAAEAAPLADEATADDSLDMDAGGDAGDAAGGVAAEAEEDGESFDPATSPFYLGQFTSIGALERRLATQPFIEPEIFDFATCQDQLAALETADAPTLVGLADLERRLVEIHRVPATERQLVVDGETCTIIDELVP